MGTVVPWLPGKRNCRKTWTLKGVCCIYVRTLAHGLATRTPKVKGLLGVWTAARGKRRGEGRRTIVEVIHEDSRLILDLAYSTPWEEFLLPVLRQPDIEMAFLCLDVERLHN
ncbi:hypothetical protein NDU88_006569 [Pleurodeles waltl]|uniref:Uncharacterized protein n=1 Tax=Pleurodeles waltl TaxID=8319 RepID=A0AAV7UQD4_PLEWA|nr:hypothetical protein NDU88_006569 [Pleurodeles waltl]